MTGWLVVNADDLGVSRGATLGVLEAHQAGIVTSASLAVTTSHYEHALASCVRVSPDLGVGLHFTLTSGKPVSDARLVPLLVDANGYFCLRFTSLFAAAVRGQADLLHQIETELDAQVGRLVGDGVRPDHIDGERHVHLIPGIFERVANAARRHGIPYVRAGRDLGGRLLRPANAAGVVMGGGLVKSWLLTALSARHRRLLGNGLRSADYVASYLHTGRTGLFLDRLLGLPPVSGVTEVMVHPGIPEESRGSALGNPELERYVGSVDRRAELQACVAAKGRTGAWRLTNYRRLAAEPTAP